VVSYALDRERRRRLAANDAAIRARAGRDRDLDDLAQYAVGVELDDHRHRPGGGDRLSPPAQEPALSRAVHAALDLD
jgi:hypothetical protein